MSHTRSQVVLFATIATFAGAVHQGHAQDAFAARDLSARSADAQELERRAHEMTLEGRGWKGAADLYRRAAELRGTGDAKSADNLRLAGYIHFYSDRPQDAVLTLVEAGDAFLALGDVERAAGALIDGAWVATQAAMALHARELGERARLLTRSPLLRTESRMALARRLGPPQGME